MKNTIAFKLKTLRNAKGLTQEQAADAIGTTRAALAGYETGRRNPRLPELQKFAEFYGVGLDFFGVATSDDVFDILARAKDVFASEVISKDEKEKLYKELMRLYLQLSDGE